MSTCPMVVATISSERMWVTETVVVMQAWGMRTDGCAPTGYINSYING